MKLIEPMEVTPARVLTTNVAITETEWTAGTYTIGQQRYVGTMLYQVVAASTTDEPTAGAAKAEPTWVLVGGINRFRSFDGILGQATANAGSIEYRIQGVGIVNGIALYGLEGNTATVRIIRAADEVVLLERSWELQGRGAVGDWWEWLFTPFDETREVLIADGPPETDAIIEIDIDAGAGEAKLGEAFLGLLQGIGTTLFGTNYEDEDFSRVERDIFGNNIVVERPVATRISFSVMVDKPQLPRVQRLLRSRRAKPTVFIGAGNWPTTIVPGFPKNVQVIPVGPDHAEMLFEVEGLI